MTSNGTFYKTIQIRGGNMTFSRNTAALRPNYGYYYFKPYMLMLLSFLFIGTVFILWGEHNNLYIWTYLGLGTGIYGLVTTAAWALARYVIPGNRVNVARTILSQHKFSGAERVIDIGSGRGLYAIEAARFLDTGKVVGIDVWVPEALPRLRFQHKFSQPTGNSIANAARNAELAGVKDKVQFINMDAGCLEFKADTFDMAICGFILGHLRNHRRQTIGEVLRVLKPGGKLVLVDNVRDFVYFLLSTPHLFLLSLIRNTKARQLTRDKWLKDISAAGFEIENYRTQKGLIILTAVKPDRIEQKENQSGKGI